jgi:biopolymer transport protein TolR
MTVGTPRGQKADINVTPPIDVLLVLIIIFMVITPTVPVGLDALVPQQQPADGPAASHAREIVVSVHRDGIYQLNQETLDRAALGVRLAALFKNRANQVIFVRSDKDLDFRDVVDVLDMARGAGVDCVASMTN